MPKGLLSIKESTPDAKAPAGKQDAPETYVTSNQVPADAKTPDANETKTASPFAASVQSILNTGIGDNKTVKEKLDDDEQFADELAKKYEQLGILKEG